MKQNRTLKSEVAEYVCTFKPATEGGYVVRCSAFPGLITHGKTLESARKNAREALELCIESYQEKGLKLPKPTATPKRTIQELISITFPLNA